MSDMADFIIGQGFGDAYDNEEDDYVGTCTPAIVRPVTCRRCGKKNLHWMKTDAGWRTAEKGEIHRCA